MSLSELLSGFLVFWSSTMMSFSCGHFSGDHGAK